MKKFIPAILMALCIVGAVFAISNPSPAATVYTNAATYSLSADLDTLPILETGAYSKVGSLIAEPMTCAAGSCSINAVLPAAEGTYALLFTALPTFNMVVGGNIVVDLTDPSAPVLGPVANGAADLELDLSWSAATDANGIDRYEIYRSTVSPVAAIPANLITTTAGLLYSDLDPAKVHGTTYYYIVKAVDVAGNDVDSNEMSGVAQEAPPALVSVDSTACVAMPCHIVVTYSKAVSLNIHSGGYDQNFASATVFDWYPPLDPTVPAKYSFDFTAARAGFANVLDDYVLDLGGATSSITIGGNMNSISIVGAPIGVKTNAINNGLDWVIIGYQLQTTGNNNVEVSMEDFIQGATNVIDLPAYDADPLNNDVAQASCGYNPATLDLTGAPIAVENAYTGATLDCSGSGNIIYLKINVPLGALSPSAPSTVVNFKN